MSEINLSPAGPNRRTFIRTGGAAAAVAGFSAGFPSVTLGKPDERKLKIGLVGCGGRGTGALRNALHADDRVEIHALGDLYRSQVDKTLAIARKNDSMKDRLGDDLEKNLFDGLNAYEEVIQSGVDVVLLTTPPGFRPQHFRAAVEQGLHTFVEKPCATDVAGVADFLETAELAQSRGVSVLCGFCYRYSVHGRELFDRIHAGDIGDVLSIHSFYFATPVKPMPPAESRPAGMSDTEWQIANWYNFTWLAGDGIVEQGCHNVDRIAWAFHDARPEAAFGSGGRQRPNEEGNIYDHFSVTYQYPNDVMAHVEWRQYVNSHNFTGDTIVGTKGTAKFGPSSASIAGENPWSWRKPRAGLKSMYDIEHEEFFAAIRSGERKDDAAWVAGSTMLAILGRNACYTGKRLTWKELEESGEKLVPETIDIHAPLPVHPIPIPGVTN